MTETYTILVTGANAGLGYSICTRILDEFLSTRPQSQALRLIFTTRDAAKSSATKARLEVHLTKTLAAVYGTAASGQSIRDLSRKRIDLIGETMDLTQLKTVKACARRLASQGPINVLLLNAGIGGWTGIDWPKAIWAIATSPREACTLPSYHTGSLGWTCKPQTSSSEPPLGEVFTANVFGHYMLAHWLSDSLQDGRIIWTSSLESAASAFDPCDIQALASRKAYESSKRVTEILALTSERASAAKTFTPGPAKPKQYLCHPGICQTSIAGLGAFLNFWMWVMFFGVRWLGSPWHTAMPYTGAVSAVWLALAAQETLDKLEGGEGKAKWGSATDRTGEERVVRTEVDGWGWGGKEGETSDRFWRLSARWWAKGRGERHDVKEFEEQGEKVWEEMERLREEWEERLKDV